MTNIERFSVAYSDALYQCVKKNPSDYLYGTERVPEMVAKFVPALAKGEAQLGPASRAAARAVGVKPTISAIKSFLAS